jgi:hypothetical protein
MPGESKHSEKWDSLFKKLQEKGYSKESAAAIATSVVGYTRGMNGTQESEFMAEFDAIANEGMTDWLKTLSAKFALDAGSGLQDVEIMSVGTWKGFKFSQQDLYNMVDNFPRVGYRVPLKLGHPGYQGKKGFDQPKETGRPAFGWITELRRDGEKLIASISDIPAMLMELIRKKNFIRFSAEIMRNFTYKGNTYGNVLTGVALLGEELPAVETLKDIYELNLAPTGAYSADFDESQVIKFNGEGGNPSMEREKELEQALQAKEAELAALTVKTGELEGQIALTKRETSARSIRETVEQGVKDMKIPPAATELVVALALKADGLITDKHVFTQSDKTVEIVFTSSDELVKKLIEVMPAVPLKTKPEGKETDPPALKADEVKDGQRTYFTGEELDARIRKVMEAQKVEYSEAFSIVAEEIRTGEKE